MSHLSEHRGNTTVRNSSCSLTLGDLLMITTVLHGTL
jgi:hypothetical protein